MFFSVVICAHSLERIELLRKAIRSVEAQTFPAAEIIVVCDHNPELMKTVGEDGFNIKIISNEGPRGLSGARNSGVSHATGTVVAFLDDDATADPDWLAMIAEPYADPMVIAVGGDIIPMWPEERPSWFPAEFDWVIGCNYLGLPTKRSAVRNLIGCNMSVRRECFEAVGGFQSSLGRVGDNASGCEETEFFIRLNSRFAGQTILLEPRARVYHSISPSRTKWSYFVDRCKAEGRSKALMTRTVGARSGLSSETTYVRRTLPAGVLRGFKDAVRGDFSGLARSGAIVSGFALTAGSFAVERVKLALASGPAPRPFKPLRIVDADIADGLPDLSQVDAETGDNYGAAWCLIRSSGQPIKIFEMPFDQPVIQADDIAEKIASDPADMPQPPLPAADGANAPHVSVVISTRDRTDSLRTCLDSLLNQTYEAMDVVVVDNAPTSSATAELISEVYAPTGRVSYVREDTPGLGRAHNTGIAAAAGDVIAFTDDDVIVDKAWVASFAANFAQSDQIGCVTGLILPAELQTRAQYWTEQHGGFGKGLSRRVFDPETGHNDDPLFPYTAGTFGSGANMAFRRETLERMGGFDASLGAGTLARGGDDLAGFVAALQSGYQLAYEPGAIVWHHHRRSEEGMRRQAYGYGVGLGAYLTKQVVDDPKRLLFFARKFPAAIAHLFSGKSSKMSRLPSDYPSRLIWSERLGILAGVPGYFRSKSKSRRACQEPPLRVVSSAPEL